MVCGGDRVRQTSQWEVGCGSCRTVNHYCCPEREPIKTTSANLNTPRWLSLMHRVHVEVFAWASRMSGWQKDEWTLKQWHQSASKWCLFLILNFLLCCFSSSPICHHVLYLAKHRPAIQSHLYKPVQLRQNIHLAWVNHHHKNHFHQVQVSVCHPAVECFRA